MDILNLFKKITLGIGILIGIGIIIFCFAWYLFISAPSSSLIKIDEPRFGDKGAAVVEVTSDTSVSDLAIILKDKGIIKSPSTFLTIIQKLSLGRKIKQGTYVFTEPENVFTIVDRISGGEYGYEPVKITIPEGYTTFAIASMLPAKLVDIKQEDFLSASKGLEGYLFPDTYFFYPYATSSAVISLMQTNFNNRIKALEKELNIDIKNSSNFADTIILASILEKEVQTPKDMALVADLFLRRIEIGMPIQADSTLTYVKGKTSAELTMSDLTEAGPYNSYKNRGLPPTPISNPGLNAIRAALRPEPNEYLFFLSDKEGTTHFSKTYTEHLRLKEKYLP